MEHVHDPVGVNLFRRGGLGQKPGNGQANQQNDDCKMKQGGCEKTGAGALVLRPGPSKVNTQRQNGGIRLPNRRQRLSNRAVTTFFADQELRRPLLQGPSNLFLFIGEAPLLGGSSKVSYQRGIRKTSPVETRMLSWRKLRKRVNI